MTHAINPDELVNRIGDVLAELGQWWRSQQGFGGLPDGEDGDLYAAADRLFAQPDRDPREQAVLDAARAWRAWITERKWEPDQPQTRALATAAAELWPDAGPPPTCAVPGCAAVSTENVYGKDGAAVRLCPRHADWFASVTP